MPEHVNKVLINHTNLKPARNQHVPRQPEPIVCGPHQPATPHDASKDLTKDEKLVFQTVLGSLLYYGQLVDSTMLTAINDLSIVQTKSTKTSKRHLNTLLDYLCANPNASMLYRKSDMIVKVYSDGLYLSAKAQKGEQQDTSTVATTPQCNKMNRIKE